jgi:excisionase family DNA binding protein
MSRPEPRATQGAVYTMAEAARVKGVSYYTVSRAIRRGALRVQQRLGRMALIAAEDLNAWHPVTQKVPHQYRGRTPEPNVTPVLDDVVAGRRSTTAQRLARLEATVDALTVEVTHLRAEVAELRSAAHEPSP